MIEREYEEYSHLVTEGIYVLISPVKDHFKQVRLALIKKEQKKKQLELRTCFFSLLLSCFLVFSSLVCPGCARH